MDVISELYYISNLTLVYSKIRLFNLLWCALGYSLYVNSIYCCNILYVTEGRNEQECETNEPDE